MDISCFVTFLSCSRIEKKEDQTIGRQAINNDHANSPVIQKIDTILISINGEDLFTIEGDLIANLLSGLRQNEIPCEVKMRENIYSIEQDSSLIFTDTNFKYALLKVNHLDRIFLEYYKEDFLNYRTPTVKEIHERIRAIANKFRIDSKTDYVLKITESFAHVYLKFEKGELVSAEGSIYLD